MDRSERSLPPQSEFRFISPSSHTFEESPRRASTSSVVNPLLHSPSHAAGFGGSRSMGDFKEHRPRKQEPRHSRKQQPQSHATRRELKTHDIESAECLDDDAVFSSRPKLRIASIYEEWQLALPVKRGRAASTALPYAMQSEQSILHSPSVLHNMLQQIMMIFGFCKRNQYRSIDYIFEDGFARKSLASPRLQGSTIALGALFVVVLALIARLYLAPINFDLEKSFSRWL